MYMAPALQEQSYNVSSGPLRSPIVISDVASNLRQGKLPIAIHIQADLPHIVIWVNISSYTSHIAYIMRPCHTKAPIAISLWIRYSLDAGVIFLEVHPLVFFTIFSHILYVIKYLACEECFRLKGFDKSSDDSWGWTLVKWGESWWWWLWLGHNISIKLGKNPVYVHNYCKNECCYDVTCNMISLCFPLNLSYEFTCPWCISELEQLKGSHNDYGGKLKDQAR